MTADTQTSVPATSCSAQLSHDAKSLRSYFIWGIRIGISADLVGDAREEHYRAVSEMRPNPIEL